MSRIDRSKKPDPGVQQILDALAPYEEKHAKAEIVAYRQSPHVIRVRIIDPDFRRLGRGARESKIWPLLERLPEETISDITTLLLLTPDEATRSFANSEFEDPVPTGI